MPPKNIVICCDGTGNQFIEASDSRATAANSNVVKLYTALIINNDQVGYYHPGVGTMGASQARGGVERFFSKVGGLAFASGFMDNVEDAYRYLMDVYNDGDRIYLFGFSRGSYTARALAAILHAYGLLCSRKPGPHSRTCSGSSQDDMNAARLKSREQSRQQKTRSTLASQNATPSRAPLPRPIFPSIMPLRRPSRTTSSFTSSASGIRSPPSAGSRSRSASFTPPATPSSRPGATPSRSTSAAVSFRTIFGAIPSPSEETPTLVSKDTLPDGTIAQIPIPQDILQVWFAGVHSDVGGSYPQIGERLVEPHPALDA